MCATCVGCGMFGTFTILNIMRKIKKNAYKKAVFCCLIFCLLSCFLLQITLKTKKFSFVIIPSIVLGFFVLPIVPILLELANEVCFPVNEVVISGFLLGIAHVAAFGLGSLFSLLL